MKRYESLAADLEQSIRSGLFRDGEKMPSVRYSASSRGLSPSTVFQAYYLLEARGLIRARERSGYYVTQAPALRPRVPQQIYDPPSRSVSLDVSEMVFRILEASRSNDGFGFAAPFPSPFLFPLDRLFQSLASAARRFNPQQMLDGLTPGSPDLCRQIALRYHADGINVDKDEIVVTNGALEALNLCLSTVTQPGDSVVIECPSFYGALQSLQARGLKAVQVATHPTEGIDLPSLEAAISVHRPKACWLMTTFQNPLGYLMAPAKKEQLVALLARHEIPLIEDDVYAELYFDSNRPAPAKSFDRGGMVMHCSSFSKSLAPGFRVGWVAAGRFATRLARNKVALNLSTSMPSQLALADYLEHGSFDKHLRRLRQHLGQQQAAMADMVAKHFPDGTSATQPRGGYFMWVELPEAFDALKLHQDALAHRICIAPGPMFSPGRGFRNCIRLNYGQRWSKASEAAMATLGRLLDAQQRLVA